MNKQINRQRVTFMKFIRIGVFYRGEHETDYPPGLTVHHMVHVLTNRLYSLAIQIEVGVAPSPRVEWLSCNSIGCKIFRKSL